MTMPTDQEVFDKVVRHLLTQNRKSTGVEKCLYRSGDGAMCAVGCLIPDALYHSDMEKGNSGVYQLLIRNPALVEVTGDNPHLLEELQDIHDSCEVDEWPMELAKLGQEMGLGTYVLEEFKCE